MEQYLNVSFDALILAAVSAMWFLIGKDFGYQKALKTISNGIRIAIENVSEDGEDDEDDE